jgi:hypothetical protein
MALTSKKVWCVTSVVAIQTLNMLQKEALNKGESNLQSVFVKEIVEGQHQPICQIWLKAKWKGFDTQN